MIEKRKATRIRIHNKNEVRLSFYTPKKVRIEGYIWDYSRFGLGVVIPAETLKLKEKETLHIFNCSIHCFGQERNLGDASIVRMYKEKGEQFLGIYLENEFVDLDFLNEKHITHIQEDEIKSVKLEFRDMEKVIPEFKALVSDISLGFSLYKRKLDDLDKKFSKEPDILQKSLFQSILKGIGREFYQFLNDTITNLKRTVKPYNKIQHEIHGYYIRKVLWHYLMESPFIWRTNIKPRGYAGDSEMMELVYRNSYEGESSFGKIFHYHPVN
ncbi:MAG: hypothetical protein KDK45_14055, partial [Leptospiraceae bacterium]|nr:hypothetical protein [Leptospiraceae bacterium]